jgi:hypothetical protein
MISLLAVVVAVAALAVIVLGDRRQPATNPGRRGAAKEENASGPSEVPAPSRRGHAPVRAVAGTPYRPPRWYRRLGAIFGIGATTIVIGALLAIAIAILIVTGLLVLRQAVG